jgi:hypothetical protein
MRVKIREAKWLSYLLNSIEFKNIKIKGNNEFNVPGFQLKIWDGKYSKYYTSLEKLANYNGYELNYYNKLNKNNLINYDNKYTKLINIFYDNEKKKRSLTVYNDVLERNIIEEHMRKIDSRKVKNNLTKPFYFFTSGYNERTMPSQIKHWTSSVYTFLKGENSGSNYKDLYTSKILKLFFSIKGGNRKYIIKSHVINAIRVKVKSLLMDKVNQMIKYTSNRTRLAVRKLNYFPAQILTLDWAKQQINHILVYKEFSYLNKMNYQGGFFPKRKVFFKKFKKFLISRPLFKHTSFNLVIDIFIYHNKRYIFNRISSIVTRRIMYKYMYSMYINCYEKINDTINRPRFFYMNLIEPKIHKYYNLVVSYYGELIIIKKKPMLLMLYLLLLQANIVNKIKLTNIKTNINNTVNKKKNLSSNIFEESDNIRLNENESSSSLINNLELKNEKKYSIVFKRRIINSKLTKYNYLLFKKNKELYNLNKDIKEDKDMDSDKTISKSKKNVARNNRLTFNKYKKYLIDLEKKSNSPVDLNSLSLWNSKGLGKHYRTPTGIIDKSYRKNKKKNAGFSQKNHKKNNWINYNNNGYYEQNNKKKNSDLWNKKKNKFNTYGSNSNDLLNNKFKKNYNRNNTLLFEKNSKFNSYINEANSNFISKVRNINIIKLGDNEKYNKNDGLNKEQYINQMNNNIINDKLLNNIFTSFYIKNNNLNINKPNKIKSYINNDSNNALNEDRSHLNNILKDKLFFDTELIKSRSRKLNNKVGNNVNTNNINEVGTNSKFNSKILWDKLDHSIMGTLSKHVQINKDLMLGSNFNQINSLLNEIKRYKGFGYIWYLMYFISVIKKEFDNANRDILVPKKINVRPYLMNKNENTFVSEDNIDINFKHNNYNLKISLLSSYYPNERENNLNEKYGYYEKIFKPYYSYMIPLFILKSYYTFTSNYWYYNPISYFFNYWIVKFNNSIHDHISILNFLTVKILLDLLHYNYRSWIRIKPRYYYLRKVKIYSRKFHNITIKNWRFSVTFFKNLKKTPKNFWLRYHKFAGNYVNRVIQYSELNTKRQIFVPFVLYIEDVLFSVYGKWVIIRLWPLKYFYLSSYMLAKRVLMLLLWRQKQKKKLQGSNFTLSRYSLRLIEGFRSIEIKKAYLYYINNASSWPNDLLLKMNNMNKPHSLNYSNLEFFNEKEERFHYLNSYTLKYNNLSDFIPIISKRYKSLVRNYIKFISDITRRKPIIINKYNYIYYWLLPLKNYIMGLTKNTDITGIKFNLSGRPSWRRSNNRKVNKIYDHGNRLTPRHFNTKTYKMYSLYTPRLRGYLKSHIESSLSVSKSRNGSVSLKVWISSILSVDVHELLLHLVRVKSLYSQLINRYYLVPKSIVIPKKKFKIPKKNWKKMKKIKKINYKKNK